jgi:hypothetical protein
VPLPVIFLSFTLCARFLLATEVKLKFGGEMGEMDPILADLARRSNWKNGDSNTRCDTSISMEESNALC